MELMAKLRRLLGAILRAMKAGRTKDTSALAATEPEPVPCADEQEAASEAMELVEAAIEFSELVAKLQAYADCLDNQPGGGQPGENMKALLTNCQTCLNQAADAISQVRCQLARTKPQD